MVVCVGGAAGGEVEEEVVGVCWVDACLGFGGVGSVGEPELEEEVLILLLVLLFGSRYTRSRAGIPPGPAAPASCCTLIRPAPLPLELALKLILLLLLSVRNGFEFEQGAEGGEVTVVEVSL